MNTLNDTAFNKWLQERGFCTEHLYSDRLGDMQSAFNAGYLEGFNHAKKEALSTLATALDPRPSHD